MPQQHSKPHEEPRRLAWARRVVERADEGERFPDDAAVAAAREDPRLAGEPFPATDDDTWGGPWPTREWLIPDWFPVGQLGLVTGRGGLGKSRLALQLAGRLAANPPQAGGFLPPGTTSGDMRAVTRALPPLDLTHAEPVVYASWEDEREEVGRRLEKMATDTLIHVKDLRRSAAVRRPPGNRSALGPRDGPWPVQSHCYAQPTDHGGPPTASHGRSDGCAARDCRFAGRLLRERRERTCPGPGVLRRLGRLGQLDTLRRHADCASPENGRWHRGGGP